MKKIYIILGILFLLLALGVGGVFYGFKYAKENQGIVTEKVLAFLKENPQIISEDPAVQGDIPVFLDMLDDIFVVDGVLRRYLVLLQNNMELRPGGGFIGQYAIIEVQNAEVVSWEIFDANHLDKDVESDIPSPASFAKWLGIPKMEFRDSNWDLDFAENAQRALYLYNKGPSPKEFDGVLSFNANIMGDLLKISGPVVVEGYEEYGAFDSEEGLLLLQDVVEKPFLLAEMRDECRKREKETGVEESCNTDPETGKKIEKVTHAQRENRKQILPLLTKEISKNIFGDDETSWRERFELAQESMPQLIRLAAENLADRDIQLWFKDANVQSIATAKNWSTEVDAQWGGDYVAVVDANLGALKSDYYIKRRLEYTVDFTGSNAQINDIAAGRMVRYLTPQIRYQVLNGDYVTERPLATMRMSYEHSAQKANYRTSDYHAYTRLYTPSGTDWKVREWFGVPDEISDIDEEVYGDKNVYGYKFDIFIGDTLPTMLQYTLPERITEEGYALKVQKQSGVQSLPTTVKIILSDGEVLEKEFDLVRDAIIRINSDKDDLDVELL